MCSRKNKNKIKNKLWFSAVDRSKRKVTIYIHNYLKPKHSKPLK